MTERLIDLLRRRPGQYALVAIGVVIIAALTMAMWSSGSDDTGDVPLARVARGPLTISVIESGTIQNRQREIVKSEVEGSATILALVSEGTHVEKGDLLIELDSSGLVDDKAQQEISVSNAEAAFIRAREDLAVTESQTASDITQAELALKFAQLDLQKYMEGDWPAATLKAESEIVLAKETLQRAREKARWSQTLSDEGYIARTELENDQLAVKQAEIDLELAENNLEVLREYTHMRDVEQLQSDAEEAEKTLERTRRKVSADLVQAKADLAAKESEFRRQQEKLDKINDQIAKCRITAPVGGMVVYATTGQGSWRGNAEPLDEGQQVRERQELIHLPTTSKMMAEVKVHESSLQKVTKGMPVRITVDAMPGEVFWGRVSKIGLLPDAQSVWMNPDLKVYQTEIDVLGDGSALRPGMTCLAEIVVEQHEDALYVPLQSVTRVGSQSVVYLPGNGAPQMQPVKVGLDNNRLVHVLEGLREGQQVLLSPPLAPSQAPDAAEAGERPPAGTQLAEESVTTQPAETAEQEAAQSPAIDLSKLREMTPEQQRAVFEQMTPEQRETLRRQFGGSRGERGERGGRGGRGEGAGHPPRGE